MEKREGIPIVITNEVKNMKKREGSNTRPRMEQLQGLIKLFKEWSKTIGYYSILGVVLTLTAGVSEDIGAENITGNLQAVMTDSDNCPGTPIPAGSFTAASPYTDTGDTTGANDTVTSVFDYCDDENCYYLDSHGPDRIYSFVVKNSGPNGSITVTANSPNYHPLIYAISPRLYSPGCQAGQGNTDDPWIIDDSQWGSRNFATIAGSLLPVGIQFYLFVDSRSAGDAGAYTLTVKDMQISAAVPVRTNRPDLDGDGRADLSVYRPNDSTWYVDRSSEGFSALQFGSSTDKIVPGDYDGDGKTDMAIFRDGDWWIKRSSDSTLQVVHFGQTGDIPVPADYTGDWQDELAVYRNGVWWMLDLSNGQTSVLNFGLPTDKPVVADYDGDGKADQAVYRNGDWHLNLSTTGYRVVHFGLPADTPFTGDFNGDGKADPTIYRDGTWWILFDIGSPAAGRFEFGLPSDIPVPGDYDGDGTTDIAVYRNGTWWIRQGLFGGISVANFGLPGDRPVPSAF
jgi:hypothetical protein